MSDQSPRQHCGERTVLKGRWVINDSEGVASGQAVTDRQLGLCNFLVSVSVTVRLLGFEEKCFSSKIRYSPVFLKTHQLIGKISYLQIMKIILILPFCSTFPYELF